MSYEKVKAISIKKECIKAILLDCYKGEMQGNTKYNNAIGAYCNREKYNWNNTPEDKEEKEKYYQELKEHLYICYEKYTAAAQFDAVQIAAARELAERIHAEEAEAAATATHEPDTGPEVVTLDTYEGNLFNMPDLFTLTREKIKA